MIEVRGLTKAYGEIEALRGVDLSVAAGEMCVVLGPSGAGKSTLLRCINRLTEPGTGEIDHGNVFKAIHQTGYRDYVAMEYVPSRDAMTTLAEVRALAASSVTR